VEKQLEASLRRLRTDYLDLYQCHRYDDHTPLEETMAALTAAVDSGKVRYIGFSEWPADKIKAAIDMAGVARFVSSQPQYSLLWREPEEAVIPICAANGISQIVWSPLAQGVLSGKYRADAPPPQGTRATSEEMGGFMDRLMQPELLAAVERLKPIAAEAGLSLAQFALAWVLREPNVASAIIGASRAGAGGGECGRVGCTGGSGAVRPRRRGRRRARQRLVAAFISATKLRTASRSPDSTNFTIAEPLITPAAPAVSAVWT
jgi:aryl-alcohol dehydrogenase-like predicted oxidoreductase